MHSRTSTTHLVTSNSSAAPVMDERPHPSTSPISDQASTDASTPPTTDNNDPDSPTIPLPPPPPPPPPPLPPHDLPLSKSSSPSPDNSATPTQADIKLVSPVNSSLILLSFIIVFLLIFVFSIIKIRELAGKILIN